MRILITGGAGFIGSAVVRYLVGNSTHTVMNIDKLTYAGNLASLSSVTDAKNYFFEQVDICDVKKVTDVITSFQPHKIMHLAAESHVDRSIAASYDFIQTNVIGTHVLLEASRDYLLKTSADVRDTFCFHHVSTDEVYGDLWGTDELFTEDTPYSPSSPYSASKAASDHLVRAWSRTYGLPTLVSNCSNNYGPFHFPEKLIPMTILNAIHGRPIPLYGDGSQIRDWLFVEDHARALVCVLLSGKPGQTYNIGGNNEKTNLQVVETICSILDMENSQKPDGLTSYSDLITRVTDRPGHDGRYAINSTKIYRDLGWRPVESFETGIKKTVLWYLNNKDWWKPLVERDLSQI